MPAFTSLLLGGLIASQAASTVAQVSNANAAREDAKKQMDEQKQKELDLENQAKQQKSDAEAQRQAILARDTASANQRKTSSLGRAGTILTGGDSSMGAPSIPSTPGLGAGAGKTLLGG
jgi:hypothetical protein